MKPTDCEDDLIKGMLVGILLVIEYGSEPIPPSYYDFDIVLEANAVTRPLFDLPSSFMTLMGVMYVLNLNYPKEVKYIFEVIQHLFLGIGIDSCSARVHSLTLKYTFQVKQLSSYEPNTAMFLSFEEKLFMSG
ncbi:hypothetical protein AMECASPLE_016556 [Ameca splendens]|uniref:Uncharacterized protein n=1 Tax=Ameca splendens TaxID=208324 RepID=A0ABV0ZAZ9_9TELE